MKAVNLIPLEQRRGGGAASRSGGGVYVLLGALVVLVVMATAYALSTRDVKDHKADLARVQAETRAVQAQADSLTAYTQFADMRKRRVETVASLAKSRFDWPHALHEVARTIPSDAWVTSLRGTVTPGVTIDGTPDPLRSSLPNPAIEIAGCTTTQKNVARMVASMRQIDGVERVALSSSAKSDASSASTTDGNSCTPASRPKFSMTVFFRMPAPQSSPAPAAGSGAAPAAATGAATQSQPTPASNGATK
jgi:Tfp pilus assembly protein PilN